MDRENMMPILQDVGLEFPEERRRRTLSDPSLIVVALIDGDELLGYADFCRDWRDPRDIYLSSIQLQSRYRRGVHTAKLVAATVRALKKQPFRRIRGSVQKNNAHAVRLFRKLGMLIHDRADGGLSWDIGGDRALIESEWLTRLIRRVERESLLGSSQRS